MHFKTFTALLFTTVFAINKKYLVSGQENHWCTNNREDFDNNGWFASGPLKLASKSSELPAGFQDKLVGQYEDVFYFDHFDSNPVTSYLVNNEMCLRERGTAYMYIKYYAHKIISGPEFYAAPEINIYYAPLNSSPDFAWKELFMEVDSYYGVCVIEAYNLEQGNYLFVDTIIYTTGRVYNVTMDMEAVKSLCPPNENPTSTTTISTESTTSEPPTNPDFNCVDTQPDFENNWLSYPFNKYAYNSSLLPQELVQLTGQGIFFMEGSNSFDNMFFFKNYLGQPDWDIVPTYLYIKYYAHTVSNNSQIVYVRPAHDVTDEHHIHVLPPGKGFSWEQIIVEIETLSEEQWIEIGTKNFKAGEYFLIEKIGVARSNNYSEVLEFIQSCSDK